MVQDIWVVASFGGVLSLTIVGTAGGVGVGNPSALSVTPSALRPHWLDCRCQRSRTSSIEYCAARWDPPNTHVPMTKAARRHSFPSELMDSQDGLITTCHREGNEHFLQCRHQQAMPEGQWQRDENQGEATATISYTLSQMSAAALTELSPASFQQDLVTLLAFSKYTNEQMER